MADLTAAARLDTDLTTVLITAALAEHGVVATWDRLCRPALRTGHRSGPRRAPLLRASRPGTADTVPRALAPTTHQHV